ncbi:ABC transporter ATP-binding protein [Chitinophaga rhizophila]|uniref:ABC transporter ATP-binding protein/permease n=1 Tax=Chitinophaga rhizophila TaxID=2866212 RepID=A0ABS7G678_9BACT|nr:ABC transporter ATP-binding protein [Chitinophaga rhizophila]MBW8683149.1 ABC transporter ATP-binding protein/permease [Chitinophaga rhizophila]
METRKPDPAYVKRFIRYLRPHIGAEILLLLMMLVASAGSLATPYILKIIIDDIFPKGNYSQLITILVILVVIYLVRIICSLCTDLLYSRISQRVIAAIRTDVLNAIFNRPILFFREVKPGDLLFTVMNDVQNIQVSVSSFALTFTLDLLTVIGIMIMLAILNLKLTAISLVILPAVIFSIRKFTPHLQSNFRDIQELQERLNNFVLEKIRNIRVVRSYNATRFEQDNLAALQQKDIQINTRNAVLSSLNTNITVFLIAVGPVVVLMYGGKAVFEGALTIGSLIAFIQYLNRLYTPSMNIMNSYNKFTKALVSMERVSRYLPEEQPGKQSAVKTPAFSSITFRNVSFSIEEAKILEEVNMRFDRGNIYAIIGPSGSGKSTLSGLLCDFIQPTAGEILLDEEVPLSYLSDWQHSLGLIEKENQLFSISIMENIRYGSFQASDQEVLKAAAAAGLSEFVGNLPDGYNTNINESATSLSDGQKQRISIARAFLKKANVIIFDEATASLDVKLEQQIIESVRKHHQDAIIIIITHRLQTLRYVDYVYNIENGVVVQEGPPNAFVVDGLSHHYITKQ